MLVKVVKINEHMVLDPDPEVTEALVRGTEIAMDIAHLNITPGKGERGTYAALIFFVKMADSASSSAAAR